MVRVTRNLTRKSMALVVSLLLVLFWVPGLIASPASANTLATNNKVIGNFEIDGNFYDGTDNTKALTTHAAGTADDWVDLLSGPTATDEINTASASDSTNFGQGSKECSQTGDCDVNQWSLASGTAPGKDDISKVYVKSRLVPAKTGDLFGYFGVTREANNGTTFFDFELNQKPNDSAGGISRPHRSLNDVLIVAAQQGGNSFSIS